MKKLIIILFVLASGLSSCKKDATVAPASTPQSVIDNGDIQTYLKANNITATKDSSGLYYQIITQGTGVNPTANSTITANYSGKYLDGTSFTTGNLPPTKLSGLIQGWIIGIPFVKVGGRIVLYIPSGLGYGHSPTNGIRSDAVLIFTIDLFSAQ